jgi:alkylation response protein AidB-like acyl-CoA dehydrogenase
MTPYVPPLDDIRFALQHMAGLEHISRLPGCAAAAPDLVDQVLEEAGKFAAHELAPLNAAGDRERARLDNGAVRTPKGYKEAYWKFVEGGWHGLPFPEEWGGQSLPWSVAIPVWEMWHSAIRVLPVPDPHPGRGRAAAPSWHRGAARALPAQAGERRVDRHHVPDRAARRLGRGRAQDQGGA